MSRPAQRVTSRSVPRFATAIGAMLFAAACSSATAQTPSTRSSPTTVGVSSTLDGLSRLPYRIPWEVTPDISVADVSEVDFYIDGALAWVEYKAPYVYGDDGNWLVASFLTPGEHTFTVTVVPIAGKPATRSVSATTFAPPAPPAALAGIWTRTVTAADMRKSTSGMPGPLGVWRLMIVAAGWELLDPQGNKGLFDVGNLSSALEMRPTIEYPPFPNTNNGGFCANTDPIFDWTYAVGRGGRSLTLHPKGQDPCGDRAAILEGTWTRVS
jgi:hypothetical protein